MKNVCVHSVPYDFWNLLGVVSRLIGFRNLSFRGDQVPQLNQIMSFILLNNCSAPTEKIVKKNVQNKTISEAFSVMWNSYLDEHVIKSWICCQVHTICHTACSLSYCEIILALLGRSSIQIFLNFNLSLTLFW